MHLQQFENSADMIQVNVGYHYEFEMHFFFIGLLNALEDFHARSASSSIDKNSVELAGRAVFDPQAVALLGGKHFYAKIHD